MRPKTYSYLIHDGDENKKAKITKKFVIKQKLKLKAYKNCLETNQLKNEINHLEKNDIKVNHLRENHKEIMKNNRLV